ncbi:hypothetical protein PPERSA_13163 [Pseudocohnilembus persalinus]|uniref:Uncharacterized protein n=1 Tax=Pseudocohnilembus persalinus TaxID=266149 RepID=A0A0V0QKZ2_PSEPJ|nr:hypothetical protein PPERSA_13163 [Pseudocohnilembus persalinus]|eukprot:KRX02909.1 hypothetical protein PPERSA_13163 [Pseudocohnilembus persalinus]
MQKTTQQTQIKNTNQNQNLKQNNSKNTSQQQPSQQTNSKSQQKQQKQNQKVQQLQQGKKALDDLFAVAKVTQKIKKEKQQEKEKEEEKQIKIQQNQQKKKKIDKSLPIDKINASSSNRRKTEEGYNVYTEEELKLGQGGGTKDCPFDCWCCY